MDSLTKHLDHESYRQWRDGQRTMHGWEWIEFDAACWLEDLLAEVDQQNLDSLTPDDVGITFTAYGQNGGM